ncbi:MAG TPA: hypothetical protein VNT20_10190 [Flavisolibacter sp.]|jgi:hypothetical protein|nr:hypothetical protein [Flavisolibacter sp.]
MKQIVLSLLAFIALGFISNTVSAQQAITYQPGEVLRVDFEGKHKLLNHASTDSTKYQPGSVLRIDFEGLHSIKAREQTTQTSYQPGAALRIDFEGRHRKQH